MIFSDFESEGCVLIESNSGKERNFSRDIFHDLRDSCYNESKENCETYFYFSSKNKSGLFCPIGFVFRFLCVCG